MIILFLLIDHWFYWNHVEPDTLKMKRMRYPFLQADFALRICHVTRDDFVSEIRICEDEEEENPFLQADFVLRMSYNWG